MNATSENIGAITAALAKAQGAMGAALIDGSANVKLKSGGSYGYTYASLTSVWNAIRKPLSDNGLAVIQRIDDENGVMFLYTILSHESGEYITSRLAVGSVGRPAQETGSALTYARRYALSALVGVVTDEDDDGAEATKQQRERQQPRTNGNPPTMNGNGMENLEGAPVDISPWDDDRKHKAVEWAMKRYPGVYDHYNHGMNSLNNLMRDYPDMRGDALKAAWIDKVRAKVDEMDEPTHADLDAQAAAEA